MRSLRWLPVISALMVVLLSGQSLAQKSQQNYEIMRMIRHQKFDLILPGALRDNNVEMWIHVIKSGQRDPLQLDLGGWSEYRVWEPVSYYIFTDRGGDRIERILLAAEDFDDLYDATGSGKDLIKIVEERDPAVIAVNMSDSLPIADGLSHTEYLRLTNVLGEKYSKRLVSAANVITDFRVRRVQLEIIAFASALKTQINIMERALKSVRPGITTPDEIGWWAADRLLEQGIPGSYQAATLFTPYAPRGAHGETYQRGDFLSWDMGIGYLNFGTDIKRHAYILKAGEDDIPDGLKIAWERGMQVRKILRDTFKIGKTAGDSLQAIVDALETSGFVYTPSDDRSDQYDKMIRDLGDDPRSGFTIDFHATGNTSVGDATAGPSMAPWRSTTADIMVQANYIFALEFELNTWVPEWNRRVSIAFEDNAIVTFNGVEYLSPIDEKIIVIR